MDIMPGKTRNWFTVKINVSVSSFMYFHEKAVSIFFSFLKKKSAFFPH